MLVLVGLAAPAVAADVVSLRYGWKRGDAATYEAVRADTGSVGQTSSKMNGRIVASKGKKNGIRLDYLDLSAEMQSGMPQMDEILEGVAALGLSVRITKDGVFDGLDGVEGYQTLVKSALEVGLRDAAAAYPAVPADKWAAIGQSLKPMFSAEVIRAQVEDEWNLMVGFWLGADLEVGQEYALETVAALPIGGAAAPYSITFRAEGLSTCSDAGGVCVRLSYRSVPDPAAVTTAIMGVVVPLLTSVGPEAEVQAVVDHLISEAVFEVANEMDLVTEPGTLRPWFMEVRKVVSIDMALPNGQRMQQAQRTVQTSTYTWTD